MKELANPLLLCEINTVITGSSVPPGYFYFVEMANQTIEDEIYLFQSGCNSLIIWKF